jgi:hypothetical protein
MPYAACPAWCRGGHAADGEHYSVRTQVGELIVELIQYPSDGQMYLSLLEPGDAGRYFEVPMSAVPMIATAALRLTAGVST